MLAFRNLSGDPEHDYFADGVVEDITTTLSRIPLLVVIARHSSYAYRGRSVDVRQVGRGAGARYVLTAAFESPGAGYASALCSSMQQAEGISGPTSTMEPWRMSSICRIKSRRASSRPSHRGNESRDRARASKADDNLNAYDLSLRALAEIGPDPTESSLDHAVGLLRRAIAADPQFAPAYGSLASAYWNRVMHGWGSIDEALRQGFEAAKLAVELAKDNPVALSLGGYGIAYLGGQPKEGLAHIERALAINPNSLSTLRFAGHVCWMIGDHSESIRYFERAMQLGPQDYLAWESSWHLGSLLFSWTLRPGFPLVGPSAPDEATLWSSGTRKIGCMGDGRHPSWRIAGRCSATEVRATRHVDSNDHEALASLPIGRSRAVQGGSEQGGTTRIDKSPLGAF